MHKKIVCNDNNTKKIVCIDEKSIPPPKDNGPSLSMKSVWLDAIHFRFVSDYR